MLAVIKGAGDLATGVARRFFMSGFSVVMTEIEKPTTVRRTAAFSSAVSLGRYTVENVCAVRANGTADALEIASAGNIAVLVDPYGECVQAMRPPVLVDAIIAKRNTGTKISDAPAVIALGPGFTAGVDCHCVVETKRGHNLGRTLYSGSAAPDTGIPGDIGGHCADRLLRSTADGTFHPVAQIGDTVSAGQLVAYAETTPVQAAISGVLRGLLAEGTPVYTGMKAGDIDPRCEHSHCFTVSDKANAIAGGALEAALRLTGALNF